MPKMPDTRIAWGSAKESKQIIIDAAARCFERYGPQRTSMEDIAEAAGISRKTLYRVFEDRPKLIQAVLLGRWAKITERTKKRVAKATSFEEALLEGSVIAVSAVIKDELTNEIIHKATDHTLEQFLIRGNERTRNVMHDIWRTAIDEGRRAGVVKPNLSDERILDIISSLHALLIMRDEGPAKQRKFLNDVLLPAIIIAPEG